MVMGICNTRGGAYHQRLLFDNQTLSHGLLHRVSEWVALGDVAHVVISRKRDSKCERIIERRRGSVTLRASGRSLLRSEQLFMRCRSILDQVHVVGDGIAAANPPNAFTRSNLFRVQQRPHARSKKGIRLGHINDAKAIRNTGLHATYSEKEPLRVATSVHVTIEHKIVLTRAHLTLECAECRDG